MKTLVLFAAAGAICAPMLSAAPAHAQATRTWVSGVGDDVNPCSRTAPCKTFAGAISKTFINGEINCLDPGGFGAVTITKSITIDCHEIFASILASGTTGVTISIATGNVNDPLRTVRLRNININGTGASGAVGTRTGINGINILNAENVFIEDVLISDFSQSAVRDARSTTGTLSIKNSTFRHNAGNGITVIPTQAVNVVVDNVSSLKNNFGIAVGGSGHQVAISRSNMSGNATAGLEVDPGGEINVDSTTISHNGTGVQANGVVRLSNSDISFNGTGITGTAFSFGTNRISGNAAAGTAPSPMGGASNALGQQ